MTSYGVFVKSATRATLKSFAGSRLPVVVSCWLDRLLLTLPTELILVAGCTSSLKAVCGRRYGNTVISVLL